MEERIPCFSGINEISLKARKVLLTFFSHGSAHRLAATGRKNKCKTLVQTLLKPKQAIKEKLPKGIILLLNNDKLDVTKMTLGLLAEFRWGSSNFLRAAPILFQVIPISSDL
ncbi:hypothetical protein AVEN_80550-1 [Araneus ventricosus]|uniref:Uncharacterized protein n=1 Tax=Araneus ventricosus TaxID=182803 RepID=A0A4Y2CRP4_ARAVE|nr:hypothetical protein AVEN_80550-1 [Araneus ventricosus]